MADGSHEKNPGNLMLTLLVSLGYCYYFVTKIPKGILRVIFLLPVFYLFSTFPWCSSSATLRGVLSYFITWIGSFKLLLFCFHRGPLADPNNTTFLDFIVISILPFKVQDHVPHSPDPCKGSSKSFTLRYGGVLAKAVKRYEVVPLFNQPYLATSLQDFWGRRWNRLSSNILRLSIYDPTRDTLEGVAGPRGAKVVATITTLVVSGVMHEVMLYYITCGMRPSWEVTRFFVLQGLCLVLEAILRRKQLRPGMKWRPAHTAAFANALTVGFVMVTSYWLLILPVWKNGQDECAIRW